jgi:diguanylate cyclase (GGDEF)-like protein
MDDGPAARPRVLLIEDDQCSAAMLRAMLQAAFHRDIVLTHVERLGGAIRELRDHSAGCVLLDLMLPEGAGTDPLAEVRSVAPEAPVIALYDGGDEEIALRALRHGAQEVLVRDQIDTAGLRRAVAHAIERHGFEAGLAHQALHDALTGLPNRALLMDRLEMAVDRSRRTGSPLAVMFLDLDGFKHVNDTLGHGAGDSVLVALAHRLRAMLRPMDTVARFGGDEFALLFEEIGSEREVVLIAERISQAAALPISLDHGDVSVSVSIGIAIVSDAAIAPETLIREADAAMYRAKALGPSHYELFDEASRRRAMERLETEAALRHALDRGELRVHYQPKVSLTDHAAVTGFEALVRWEHPERGLIAPAEFMPLAEETGLVLQVGEFVLRHALDQLGRWRASNPGVTISVNLSPRQLEDAGLVSLLSREIKASGAEPSALCLEVTEAALSHNPERALRMLESLKGLGVTIAIDDYGAGASSLANLMRLPVDTLKIHESFVASLADGRRGIVGVVVDLAHALGLQAVAEGVETDSQLDQLRMLGCDSAQGYLLGRPVPHGEAEEMLAVER